MRDGNAPNMARWVADGDARARPSGRPTSRRRPARARRASCSARTTTSPRSAGSRRRRRRSMACSAPADCARDRAPSARPASACSSTAARAAATSSRARPSEVILTVSRMEAEKGANPGYRAFFANGFNVTRALVLFVWEVLLEWTAALRAIRRDVQPRGHRGGLYPFMRAAMCVVVRDLIVYGVLTDMMQAAGPRSTRPSRATTRSRTTPGSSGPTRSRRCASSTSSSAASTARAGTRRARTRSSCSPTTARRRARRSSSATATGSTISSSARSTHGDVKELAGGDEQNAMVGLAVGEATGTDDQQKKRAKNDVSDREVVVLGSGNLGLIYLMEERRRLTLEEIEDAPPRAHPRAPRASARRLAPRALGEATAPSRSAAAAPTTSREGSDRGRRSARDTSPPTRRTASSAAPTASRTSPTSWSAASTTRSSTRAARSRS